MNQAFAYRKGDNPYPWANCWTACEDTFVMGMGRFPYPLETAQMIQDIGGKCDVWKY